MNKRKVLKISVLFSISLAGSSNIVASEGGVVAEIHANPPVPCIAKGVDDKSSGIAIFPDGDTREELRGIMGGMASMFLVEGASYMSAKNTEVVYTAVFYEDRPINEIGIYAYKFREEIESNMFKAHAELNGKFLVIGKRLLVLLWHENYDKTSRCFEALNKSLTAINSDSVN